MPALQAADLKVEKVCLVRALQAADLKVEGGWLAQAPVNIK